MDGTALDWAPERFGGIRVTPAGSMILAEAESDPAQAQAAVAGGRANVKSADLPNVGPFGESDDSSLLRSA